MHNRHFYDIKLQGNFSQWLCPLGWGILETESFFYRGLRDFETKKSDKVRGDFKVKKSLEGKKMKI